MKSILLTAAVSALALGANAQISIIPEAGVSLANYRYKTEAAASPTGADVSGTTSTKAGFRGGVNVGFGIGDHVSIQPGLFFAMKGGDEKYDNILGAGISATRALRLNYLELPVNVVYYFMEDQSGFFLNVGAYGGMLMSAKGKLNVSGAGQTADSTVNYSVGGDEAKDYFRRWDIGFQGGAGYQTKMGLMIRAQYAVGAMNIISHNNSANAVRNGMLSISLGYKFGW